MNKQRCYDCLFADSCSFRNRLECCEYYCSTEDDEEVLDTYIEARRREFYREWFAYTREDYE